MDDFSSSLELFKMNAKYIEVSAYYAYNVVYLCCSLLEQ